MASRETIETALESLGANWGRRAGWKDEVIAPWYTAFKGVDDRDFDKAVQRVLEDPKQESVPTIGQMRVALNVQSKSALSQPGCGRCTGGWAEVARHWVDPQGVQQLEIRACRCTCAAGRARPGWVASVDDVVRAMTGDVGTTAVYPNPTMEQRRHPRAPRPVPRAPRQAAFEARAMVDTARRQDEALDARKAKERDAESRGQVSRMHWSERVRRAHDVDDDNESEEDE